MNKSDKSNSDQRRRLAEYWMKSLPSIEAFVHSAIPNFHDAEDVIQLVAQQVAAKFDHYDISRPFIAWSIGIAKFRIIDYYRQCEANDQLLSVLTLNTLAASYQIFREEEVSDRQRALEFCMEKLKQKQRQLIEMRYLMDQKPIEIAHSLGTTSATVRVALNRIRKALTNCITQRLHAGDTK